MAEESQFLRPRCFNAGFSQLCFPGRLKMIDFIYQDQEKVISTHRRVSYFPLSSEAISEHQRSTFNPSPPISCLDWKERERRKEKEKEKT